MADAVTTFNQLSQAAPDVWISAKMIELLDRILVIPKIAEAYPLEQKNSKTLRANRFKRLTLPNTPLTEGVTPATLALEVESQEVTVEQWGIVTQLTDVVQLTVRHPILNIAIERTSMAMKETAEREDALVLMDGTNITYAGGKTSRANLVATDVITTPLIINIKARMTMRGAPKYLPDGLYCGLMQPPHVAAITGSDQTFQQASNFARVAKLEYGYLGPWQGVDWIEGNFLPQFVGVEAPTTSAPTVTKARYTNSTSGGTLAAGDYIIKVVGRELITDYERRFSQESAAITTTGATSSIAVDVPTSVNYSYDVYCSQTDGSVLYKVASRVAGGGSFTITTQPVGTEAVPEESPANGVSVYPGWVVGRSAFGTCVLNGMSLQTFLTPATASDSDPLFQRRKVGAKYMRKSFILDNNFFERFETSSDIPAQIPA